MASLPLIVSGAGPLNLSAFKSETLRGREEEAESALVVGGEERKAGGGGGGGGGGGPLPVALGRSTRSGTMPGPLSRL